MKSYNHVFDVAISDAVRAKAFHDVCNGRKRKRKWSKYLKDLDAVFEISKDWIINYDNKYHNIVTIHDGISKKQREIMVPKFDELIVQHCVVEALMPMFMNGMYEHSYASIPGRGAHQAKKVIKSWIKRDKKNVKYVLKMDIKHFFNTIPHDILKEKLRLHIHDQKMLDLLYKIIDVTDIGIPLGFYTSQWFSNWYLTDMDHYIKEKLGVKHYVRYMDDMVIFGSNKRELHKVQIAIKEYLRDFLGLEMKSNWQVFRFDYIIKGQHYGRCLDFMGFKFYRNKVTLRKTIMLKATRKAKKIFRKDKCTIYDARQMLSYLGWIDATDTYQMFLKWIKPYVTFRKLKQRISRYDRRLSKEVENDIKLQSLQRFTTGST